MKILTKNGKALCTSGGALVSVPRYFHLWGYHQAKNDVTTERHDWAAVYDWIYQCFSEGLSAGQRTITVGGTGYTFNSDGGDALSSGSIYKTGFRRIVVPLIQFGITSNTANNDQISRVVKQVTRDNQTLCYYKTGFEVNTINGATPSGQVSYGGKVGYFTIIVPNDTQRTAAQARIEQAVTAIKAKVKEVTGYTTEAARSWTASDWKKRRNVVKVIHDWIMDHTNYKDSEDDASKYWSQVAYSPFAKADGIFPVCAGYASALVYLCNLYHINALYVGGGTNGRSGGHAWAMMSFVLPMGNFTADATKWAAIDLTWDDSFYDRKFSAERTYTVGQGCFGPDGDWWVCHTAVTTPGAWTGTENWTWTSSGTGYSTWWCFAVDGMYTRDGRNNGARGFPVSVPTAYYPYYGSDLYGIAEADWTAPASTT